MISFNKLTKRFGSTLALCDVSFDCEAGTIHAITGENGAGKSTLMNLLTGLFPADSGEILLRGKPVSPDGLAHARRLGISTIFQELTLLPNLTIAENLFLGREPVRFGTVDRSTMREKARATIARLGRSMDVDAYCGDLSVADQHLVEIAKGISVDADIFIFDEPTAALNAPEVDKLGELLATLKAAGKLVFYVSHRLDEIFRFCDRVSVLKDGRHVETRSTKALTRDELVSLMVGRVLSKFFPARPARSAEAPVALSVEELQVRAGGPTVSFELRSGEIVGLAGLEGQGQRTIIRAVSGLERAATAKVTKADKAGPTRLEPDVVRTALAGVGFVPEERKTEGLYLPLSISENITLGMLRRLPLWKLVPRRHDVIAELMRRLNIRSAGARQEVGELSGGNQQKVMIGRWLAAGIDVLLLEEPTRGVDVGAKAEIYGLLREFTNGGGAVLTVSSELLELLGLCDRILVVRQNEIVAELEGAQTTEEEVMRYALAGMPGCMPMLELARKSRRTGLSPIVLALPVALFVGLCLASGTFRSLENLANVNSQIAPLIIASLGQGIVAISGGIDLSVGSVMSLTSAILVSADPALGVPLALAVGVIVGLINGFGVTLFRVHPLVMTLATMTFVQGVALLLHPVPGGAVPGYLRALAVSPVAGMPAAFFWCAAAILLAWYLLNRSPFGLRTYAVGANPVSAGRNGIAVRRQQVACFVLCSLSAVIAGIFLTARVGAGDATMGNPYSLDTVTAMALGGVQLAGGTGSVPGIVAGVITLGLISNGMNLLGISPFLRAALTGALLLMAIGLQRREAIGA